MRPLTGIILAAGMGTRMKSEQPKVLHAVCGLPIVHHGVQAALDAGCSDVVVVVGQGGARVEEYLARAFAGRPVRTAVQEAQRGTGDAARAGLAVVGLQADLVLVMNGDVPLVRGTDLLEVAKPVQGEGVPPPGGGAPALSIATCVVDDASGYGRILREPPVGPCGGAVREIREQRDLRDDAERSVREINAGIYVATATFWREALATLRPDNAQGELYLTDVVGFASRAGRATATVTLGADVLAGVNDREQLAQVEEVMHAAIVRRARLSGATVREGARLDARVVVEPEAVIERGAMLRGATRVGRGALVDVGCVLTDVTVGPGAQLKPYSVATDSRIGAGAQIGPFAHLRPGSEIGDEAHVGNFVETKKTTMGKGAKANHLAYLGDGVVGAGANIGAGTIFCNYDGFQKHTTTIEEGAFIGSDSQLVAPVRVGANAYVATGTTVTRDVPADALAISRVKQENKEGYASRLKARMRAAKEAKAK
jgi:bifunctional UDP-N-acetylglucosamine pyrophosphorylase / glucosamine-1-phosphate N-acetyltransferase